jgi:hypothetical protein
MRIYPICKRDHLLVCGQAPVRFKSTPQHPILKHNTVLVTFKTKNQDYYIMVLVEGRKNFHNCSTFGQFVLCKNLNRLANAIRIFVI